MENNIKQYVLDLPEKTFQEFYLAVMWRGLLGKNGSMTNLPENISSFPFPNEVSLSFVRKGEYIKAIKEYRQNTGLGLRESKDMIDFCRDNIYRIDFHKQPQPDFFSLIEQKAIQENFDEFVIRSVMLRTEFKHTKEKIEAEIREFREK